MNWRRGLNRLWVVSTCLWIGAVLLFFNNWYFTFKDYVVACALPPVLVYATGATTWWAMRGFRKKAE